MKKKDQIQPVPKIEQELQKAIVASFVNSFYDKYRAIMSKLAKE